MPDAETVLGLPPGPPLRLFHTVRYLRDPYAMLRECARRYDNLFTVRTARLCVVTGRPEERLSFGLQPKIAERFGMSVALVYLLAEKNELTKKFRASNRATD